MAGFHSTSQRETAGRARLAWPVGSSANSLPARRSESKSAAISTLPYPSLPHRTSTFHSPSPKCSFPPLLTPFLVKRKIKYSDRSKTTDSTKGQTAAGGQTAGQTARQVADDYGRIPLDFALASASPHAAELVKATRPPMHNHITGELNDQHGLINWAHGLRVR